MIKHRCCSRKPRRRKPAAALACILVTVVSSGCARSPKDAAITEVVLYTSVDETFARQIISDYEKDTGRKVRLVGDSEAGKTTGLVNLIRQEKDRPRADVFWSSEQSQTVLLAREGAFAPYASSAAAGIPDQFKDAGNLWTGFALRARVVAYDPERTDPANLPARWEDYARPEWAARLAIANPLFGTTRGHVAAMHALWGDERFGRFLTGLVEGGATLADGNSTAVRKLIADDVDVAFTDSDDVVTARARGHSVDMVFPDMGDGGTMIIPNTVALIKGGPHPDEAKQLIDYLLSPKVEAALARSASANYPVRADVAAEAGLEVPPASQVGFDEVADHMDPAIAACREILLK